jgi:hypothetical protein
MLKNAKSKAHSLATMIDIVEKVKSISTVESYLSIEIKEK